MAVNVFYGKIQGTHTTMATVTFCMITFISVYFYMPNSSFGAMKSSLVIVLNYVEEESHGIAVMR